MFPGGLPSKYWPGSTLLNFSEGWRAFSYISFGPNCNTEGCVVSGDHSLRRRGQKRGGCQHLQTALVPFVGSWRFPPSFIGLHNSQFCLFLGDILPLLVFRMHWISFKVALSLASLSLLWEFWETFFARCYTLQGDKCTLGLQFVYIKLLSSELDSGGL